MSLAFRFSFPAVAISGTHLFCPTLIDAAESATPALRPPDWVFGAVWPALYASTGIAWTLAGSDYDLPFTLLVASMCAWLVVNNCKRRKRAARLLLAWSASLSWFLAIRLGANSRRALVLPLAAWLTFAAYLDNH